MVVCIVTGGWLWSYVCAYHYFWAGGMALGGSGGKSPRGGGAAAGRAAPYSKPLFGSPVLKSMDSPSTPTPMQMEFEAMSPLTRSRYAEAVSIKLQHCLESLPKQLTQLFKLAKDAGGLQKVRASVDVLSVVDNSSPGYYRLMNLYSVICSAI